MGCAAALLRLPLPFREEEALRFPEEAVPECAPPELFFCVDAMGSSFQIKERIDKVGNLRRHCIESAERLCAAPSHFFSRKPATREMIPTAQQ